MTPETQWGRLWVGFGGDSGGAFGKALRRLGEALEAFGASKLILGPPLGGSESLGDSGGAFGEALGAFQSLSSPRAFSSSPIYKK